MRPACSVFCVLRAERPCLISCRLIFSWHVDSLLFHRERERERNREPKRHRDKKRSRPLFSVIKVYLNSPAEERGKPMYAKSTARNACLSRAYAKKIDEKLKKHRINHGRRLAATCRTRPPAVRIMRGLCWVTLSQSCRRVPAGSLALRYVPAIRLPRIKTKDSLSLWRRPCSVR